MAAGNVSQPGTPWRIRYALSALVLLFLLGSAIVKVIDGLTWLDAFYFVVVTLSTVGFGDVTPGSTATKLLSIVLIVAGISLIAFLGHAIVERALAYRLSQSPSLPRKPLDLEGHLILSGYGRIGNRLAQLLRSRGFEVIVVEHNAEQFDLARHAGFVVLQADITRADILELVGIQQAAALFLVLPDDPDTIKAAVLARSISPDLHIYAPLHEETSAEVAKMAGIDRPVSLVRELGDIIHGHLTRPRMRLIKPHQQSGREQRAVFLEVVKDFPVQEMFEHPLVLGEVSWRYHSFHPGAEETGHATHLLVGVTPNEFRRSQEIAEADRYERVIVAGFTPRADMVIKDLGLAPDSIVALTKDTDALELAKRRGYDSRTWELGAAATILAEVLGQHDLIISFFEDLTDAFLLAAAVVRLDRDSHLVQLAAYEHEIEAFIRAGASSVISPHEVAATSLLSDFLRDEKLPQSRVFSNMHVFEHIVRAGDQYHRRPIKKLVRIPGHVLQIWRPAQDRFTPPNLEDRLQDQDHIILALPCMPG